MTRRNTYLLKSLPFLLFFTITFSLYAQPRLIINEVSQGTNAKEYVELLVMGTPSCGQNNCLDLRGYYIDDNNGFYASGGSVGIAQGIVRFTQDPRWACVPFGTLIVIYNENDVNGSLPPDDFSTTDGNCRMIIPSDDCSLFERHTSLPNGSNSTIPTSGYIPCGSWNSLAMSNGGDSFQVINPANLTSAEFAVSYANNQNNTIIYFNVTMGGSVIYNANTVDNNPFNQANWTYGAVPTFETPGLPNNPANAAWIATLNNNCSPFPSPTISTTATDATCNCNGGATVTISGGARPFTYSWNNGVSSTDSIATDLCAGEYIVTAQTSDGCTISDTVTINQNAALTITSQAVNVSCTGSSNGSASVNTSGGTGLTYTWNPPVSSSSTATGLSPGTYTVTVSESGGCGVTDTIVITEPLPLSLQPSHADASCAGLCNGSASVTVSGGTAPYSYLWDSGEVTDNIQNLCAGSYCITVTDANGCSNDTCIAIAEPADIIISANPQNAVCNQPNGSADIEVSGGTGNYIYSWSNGSGFQDLASATPGNYCLTVTDQNSCSDTICISIGNTPGVSITNTTTNNATCNGDCNGTATIVPAGGSRPYSYTWTSISSIDSSASSLCEGSYTVIVTDSDNCKDTTIITINEPDPVLITAAPQDTVCIGETITLNASASGGTGSLTLSWSPAGPTVSPLVTSTFSVMATDENGCVSAPVQVTVPVFDPIKVTLDPPLPVCPGGSVTLNANVTGGNGNYIYSWSPVTSSSSSITLSPATEGTYSIVVSDNCTSAPDTASVEVVINNSSPVSFTSDTTRGCVPFCVTLKDNTAGSLISTWTVNGITKTGQQAEFCFSDSGNYDVTLHVQGANGCTGNLIEPSYISAYQTPVASFTSSPEQLSILSPIVELSNRSTGAESFHWLIQDSLFMAENMLYTFTDTGCYPVMLTAISVNGCRDSMIRQICVKDDFAVYIPNAFSPNGDGLNDTFGPSGFGFLSTDFVFQVFDRWGNMVYVTNDPLKPWNGKSNQGSIASPQDVYVYRIRLADSSGTSHLYKGTVTIVK